MDLVIEYIYFKKALKYRGLIFIAKNYFSHSINITVDSSCPYDLSVFIPSRIYYNNKTNSLNTNIVNIKDNTEEKYKQFTNNTDKLVLKSNCAAAKNIKLEVEQK